ncbi:MAG TPA: hypothetical protein VMM76_11355 [Pirellulaceae bacterium]|nr:hypothetical protein [Pirellulaceae bacterium]
MTRREFILLVVGIVLLATSGCAHFAATRGHAVATDELPINNPLHLPAADAEFVWMQVVDTIDDYFQIEREERMRVVGGVVLEGRIDTRPLTGATIFEPWRSDSVGAYARLESTAQSIRRRAEVRVVPIQSGYSVEVLVFKELENVLRSAGAPVRMGTERLDDTEPHGDRLGNEETLNWIPKGRDVALERQILAELYGRVVSAEPPGPHF